MLLWVASRIILLLVWLSIDVFDRLFVCLFVCLFIYLCVCVYVTLHLSKGKSRIKWEIPKGRRWKTCEIILETQKYTHTLIYTHIHTHTHTERERERERERLFIDISKLENHSVLFTSRRNAEKRLTLKMIQKLFLKF